LFTGGEGRGKKGCAAGRPLSSQGPKIRKSSQSPIAPFSLMVSAKKSALADVCEGAPVGFRSGGKKGSLGKLRGEEVGRKTLQLGCVGTCNSSFSSIRKRERNQCLLVSTGEKRTRRWSTNRGRAINKARLIVPKRRNKTPQKKEKTKNVAEQTDGDGSKCHRNLSTLGAADPSVIFVSLSDPNLKEVLNNPCPGAPSSTWKKEGKGRRSNTTFSSK